MSTCQLTLTYSSLKMPTVADVYVMRNSEISEFHGTTRSGIASKRDSMIPILPLWLYPEIIPFQETVSLDMQSNTL